MRYNEQINLKLYSYINGAFVLQAIIDDYQEISFSHNLYEAGDFTITINYNIPNALKFERGMFIQFGNDAYMFGEILKISDAIGEDGKGSQIRTITGKDSRYIFKRRIIKNLNNEENWAMTAKGEICLRELIKAQCGSGAEAKRQLPITNTIPSSSNALGKEYSVAESFSNLYDTLVTIATQSEIGWRIKFDGSLTLECFEGSDLSNQVQFSTDFDSLANGEFTDSAESFANTIYVGGKGTGSDRDIYEGESAISGNSPGGFDRFEAWDNQSSMTVESEYEAEALSMLTQYGQTINVSGQGLAKCPYIFKEQYDIGDTITLAFSGKSAKAQILSVTEHWVWGEYGIEFSFGKPQNDLARQLQLILKQIQKASNKTTTTSSVRYYTIPTDTQMPKADVIYDTIGFIGDVGNGATFQLYLDDEKTGAKTYHVWFKQLAGSGKLTLTTGKAGATDLVMNSGTYVAIIYVDAQGNITMAGATTTDTISANNNLPASSQGVASAIQNVTDIESSLPTDAVLHYSFDDIPDYPDGTAVYYANKDFVASQFSTQRCSLTVTSGKMKAQLTSGNDCSIYNSSLLNYGNCSGKICKARIFLHDTNTDRDTALFRITFYNVANDITVTKDQWVDVCFVIGTDSGAQSSTPCYIGARFFSESTDNYIIFEALYVGDGSYVTPVIDNANGQNNGTNNGGLAVKGVSGKGIRFLGNGVIYPNNTIGEKNKTFSCWFSIDNIIPARCIFCKNYNNGFIVLARNVNSVNTLAIYYYSAGYTNIAQLTANTAYHLVVICEETNIKVYLNGILATTINVTVTDNVNRLFIGALTNRSSNGLYGTVDDFLIFDRVLSETEVKALYLNRGNTPKYYSWADWKLSQV